MVYETVKKLLATGIGFALFTKEKAGELIHDWVNEGHLSKEEGEQLLTTWIDKIEQERDEVHRRINKEITRVIDHSAFVTRKQYNELEEKINFLEQRISSLEKEHR